MAEDDDLLAELLEQEARLQLDRFDNDDAYRLGMLLVERARADDMALTVDLSRVHQQLFHVALPGTTINNDHWIRCKAAVVYLFGHSSLYMGVSCRQRGCPSPTLPCRSEPTTLPLAVRSRSRYAG